MAQEGIYSPDLNVYLDEALLRSVSSAGKILVLNRLFQSGKNGIAGFRLAKEIL
jgi:hypothetical protein